MNVIIVLSVGYVRCSRLPRRDEEIQCMSPSSEGVVENSAKYRQTASVSSNRDETEGMS